MNPRITLVLVVAAVLLLGYVILVEAPKTPEQLGTPTRPAPQVFNLKGSEVKTLELHDLRRGREFKVTRSDDGWKIEKPEEKPADTFRVEPNVTSLATLQASRVFTDVTDLAPFGFVTATLEARMIMSDTTPYAITVGNKTPDGSSYYVVYTGSQRVFIIASRLVDEWLAWFDAPPYQPTPTPTFTATPPVTPTPSAAQTATTTPPAVLPSLAPTLLPTPAATATTGSGY